MEDKVKLSVLGFSFNQNRTGAYGLVFAEENGLRRLMVVVGTPEAQSIAFKLQGTPPPRPLTHDLIDHIFVMFDIVLTEVDIYKYEDGVFFSKLILEQNGKVTEIESRTSDAVGIALRTHAPIYTTEKIMQELGIVFDESAKTEEILDNTTSSDPNQDYSLLDKEELEILLKDAITGEDYELASIIRDEIKKKKGE